jgi:hypothetical protein
MSVVGTSADAHRCRCICARKAIARGLINTDRAARGLKLRNRTLQFECLNGGYCWISLDGLQLYRGSAFLQANELQSKFIEAMEQAGGSPTGDRSTKKF